MKPTWLAAVLGLAAMAALCGCRQLEVNLPGGGSLKSTSFMVKMSVGGVSISTNGTATMTNYNLDQVAGVQAVAAGVVQGMAASVKP